MRSRGNVLHPLTKMFLSWLHDFILKAGENVNGGEWIASV